MNTSCEIDSLCDDRWLLVAESGNKALFEADQKAFNSIITQDVDQRVDKDVAVSDQNCYIPGNKLQTARRQHRHSLHDSITHSSLYMKCLPSCLRYTTFSKLGVQFLGLWYYYPSTEKIDRSAQFGAVGHIITLYSSKSYVESWGSVQILGRSGSLNPPVV